jgi:phosphorylase/glycogen(starch) synthase
MLDDYYDRFYNKLFERSREIKENDFALAMEIADWKKKVKHGWEQVRVDSVRFSEALKSQLELGNDYQGEVILDLNGLSHVKMGLEMVVVKNGQK